MNTVHHKVRSHPARLRSGLAALTTLAGLTGLAGFLLNLATSPAALAMRVPAGGATRPMASGLPNQTVVVGGMPGWQIAAIALGAALAAAVTVVLAGRVRSGRRRLPAARA